MPPIRIVKGLEVPIAGEPEQVVAYGNRVAQVGLLIADYNGLRPRLEVTSGMSVRLGQTLFTDRKDERIRFTSPASGRVSSINRGERRRYLSVIVDMEGEDADGIEYRVWPEADLLTLDRRDVRENLLLSGLWTAFRTRPFSGRAHPDHTPAAVFVTAMDSNPLAADADVVIDADNAAFENGLAVVSRLTYGKVYVCRSPQITNSENNSGNVETVQFAGPHPAGLPGTHIHLLRPASAKTTVWHIGYQDVIAIGKLFTTGRLHVERIVSLCGPSVSNPRLVRTRLGAALGDLTVGELKHGLQRIVSGSVLSGRKVEGVEAYLGRYHTQITALPEAGSEVVASRAGLDSARFSVHSPRIANRPPSKRWMFGTSRGGQHAPLVSLGGYERVMPLDILPTPLIRSLMVGDSDMAQALGCLELDEEDLALCSFVCPGKIDHCHLLRQTLNRIEKNG